MKKAHYTLLLFFFPLFAYAENSKRDDSCKKWFDNIGVQTGGDCLLECSASKVDMGTFHCPELCPQLCKPKPKKKQKKTSNPNKETPLSLWQRLLLHSASLYRTDMTEAERALSVRCSRAAALPQRILLTL